MRRVSTSSFDRYSATICVNGIFLFSFENGNITASKSNLTAMRNNATTYINRLSVRITYIDRSTSILQCILRIRMNGNPLSQDVSFSAKCMNTAFALNGYGIRVLGTNSQITTIGFSSPLLLSIKRNMMPQKSNILTISQKSAAA